MTVWCMCEWRVKGDSLFEDKDSRYDDQSNLFIVDMLIHGVPEWKDFQHRQFIPPHTSAPTSRRDGDAELLQVK